MILIWNSGLTSSDVGDFVNTKLPTDNSKECLNLGAMTDRWPESLTAQTNCKFQQAKTSVTVLV